MTRRVGCDSGPINVFRSEAAKAHDTARLQQAVLRKGHVASWLHVVVVNEAAVRITVLLLLSTTDGTLGLVIHEAERDGELWDSLAVSDFLLDDLFLFKDSAS